jgi:uncharacterized membrane protein
MESIGVTGIVAMWVMVWLQYDRLPEIIPTHFNLQGQPDDFGSRGILLLLPVIATVLFVGMYFLKFIPHHFNYPVKKVTKENAEHLYSTSLRMILFLRVGIVLYFGYLTVMIMKVSQGKVAALGWVSLVLMLVLIFFPIIYFLFILMRDNKHKQLSDS